MGNSSTKHERLLGIISEQLFIPNTPPPEDIEFLKDLTRNELLEALPENPATLLQRLASCGLARYVAHLLTTTDFLAPTTTANLQTLIICEIAEHPFPNKFFPYDLLTDEFLDNKPKGNHSEYILQLLAHAPTRYCEETDENLPIFHVPVEKLTLSRLAKADTDGYAPLDWLYRAGPRGYSILEKTKVLLQLPPERFFETLGRQSDSDALSTRLGQIFWNDAHHLLPPQRFIGHIEQTLNVTREILINMRKCLVEDPDEGVYRTMRLTHAWTVKLAKQALTQPRSLAHRC